jgi:hypothetical protein
VAERAAARLAGRPEVFGKRKAIVEHVYGTLRQWVNSDDYFSPVMPINNHQ